MADEEDFEYVEAIIRKRRDARLADSKTTEGWSRGFTPNSSSRGPEHVEILLKQHGEEEDSSPGPTDPDFTPFVEDTKPTRQKTREQEDLEEALGLLLMLGLFKAAEWGKPRLLRLWSEHVIPFFVDKRDRWRERRAQRKLKPKTPQGQSPTLALVPHVDVTVEVSDALVAYEATMNSAEARQHFTEAIVAQHFANMKIRLLAGARIDNGGLPPEMVNAIEALTSAQVNSALNSMLTSKPTLVDDLEAFVKVNRDEGQLQFGSDEMKAVLRLTGSGSPAEE